MTCLSPADLKARYQNGEGEIALLDVREAGEYGMGKAFHAVNLPYSRFEAGLGSLVPNHRVTLVLMDSEDEGRARHCAELAVALGYAGPCWVQGGLEGWKAAGYTAFAGVNVVSKAFGELVHETFHTPGISPETLAAWQAGNEPVIVLDGRPLDEYRKMNIPGSRCCPNGELVRRLPAILRGDSRTPVVINCAGRTRSIIGAQTLRWLGVENPVYALENGTQGWRLAGFDLEHQAQRDMPEEAPSAPEWREAAGSLAARHGASEIDAEMLNAWLADGSSTTYVFDVRTLEEYRRHHLAGAVHAPGGQLIQATDHWVGVYRARIVLVDDDESRAPVIAAWLVLMGARVAWLRGGDTEWPLVEGLAERGARFAFDTPDLVPATLDEALSPDVLCLDARQSMQYRQAHLPNAHWVNRSLLDRQLANVSREQPLVLVANSVGVAACLVNSLEALGFPRPRWLAAEFDAWRRDGVPLEATPDQPADEDCIDFLFFVHDRHDGNLESARRYLEWETGLLDQLDEEERGTYLM
jgi:rhodanese-related sulfurtransferase